MNNKTNTGFKIITINRKASFNYFFKELFEAGIVLKGSEIKSVRLGKINIADSYAPKEDSFFDEFFILIGGTPCLVKAITLGVFLLLRASCQHSKVSIRSDGLKTFKFGVDLKLVNCSIG